MAKGLDRMEKDEDRGRGADGLFSYSLLSASFLLCINEDAAKGRDQTRICVCMCVCVVCLYFWVSEFVCIVITQRRGEGADELKKYFL